MDATDPAVAARDLRKQFADGPGVLNGVDVTVERGETFLLMGPNGSGKTVLLACLAGGLHPDTGTVSVFGKDPDDAADQLSFLLQGGLALPRLSGDETLRFYADLHPNATDTWRDITNRLDLNALDRPVRDYSGGMVRKLELAATLSVDVPLYLLDEPTVELDMTAVDALHAMLAERRGAGDTVVLTSHQPRDIRAADRVAFVRDGRIVARGCPSDLRDDISTVVDIGSNGARRDALTIHLMGGQVFESDETQTGFLAADADLADLREAVGEHGAVETRDPTPADLFNYYVHVAPDEK